MHSKQWIWECRSSSKQGIWECRSTISISSGYGSAEGDREQQVWECKGRGKQQIRECRCTSKQQI